MATRNTGPGNERGAVKQPLCPYLARFDAQERQVAPVDYPSFENHCRVVADEPSLLLTDQATFCLSGSYRLCDRFQIVHLEEGPGAAAAPPPRRAPAPAAAVTPVEEPWGQPLFPEKEAVWVNQPSRQIWAWASAAVIFAAVLLTGGGVAAYVGWELALQSGLLSRGAANAPIDTIASAANVPPTPAFIVMTATSVAPPAPVVATPPPAEEAAPAPDNTQAYPEAVTATPIVLTVSDPGPDTAANPAPADNPPPAVILQPTFTETPVPPRNLVLPDPATDATPTALINVLEAVPTRRPTPPFEVLPTDATLPPTPTTTPILAILGTPVVVFGPDESAVPPGECTRVRWHVVNVREVYYENLPSLGDGSREECIDKEANTYALRIVLADGQSKIYTTTLNVLWPTPTPTLTPSFTPEPAATETWTPQPPAATPTPNVIYAVALAIDGEAHRGCAAGADCTIGVLVTNMGDHPDTLSVEFLEKGAATARLCRQDGVCGDQKLTISNVGPNNTAFLNLRVSVPADSAGTTFSYLLRGVSDGSQGSMTSEAVKVEVTSQ